MWHLLFFLRELQLFIYVFDPIQGENVDDIIVHHNNHNQSSIAIFANLKRIFLLTIELDRVINEFHQLFIRFQLDVSRFSFHIFLFTGLQWVAAGPRVGFPRFLDFLFDFFFKIFYLISFFLNCFDRLSLF